MTDQEQELIEEIEVDLLDIADAVRNVTAISKRVSEKLEQLKTFNIPGKTANTFAFDEEANY